MSGKNKMNGLNDMSGMSNQAVQRERVVVIDFGGQKAQLIAREIRELGVYSEIIPFNKAISSLTRLQPRAVVLADRGAAFFEVVNNQSGEKAGKVDRTDQPAQTGQADQADERARAAQTGQADQADGAKVAQAAQSAQANSDYFDLSWVEAHVAHVADLMAYDEIDSGSEQENSNVVVSGGEFAVSAQITTKAQLKNFLFNTCQYEASWNAQAFIDEAIQSIRREVGDRKVLCALSGGVDSSVVAVLIHKAIGSQLKCMFIDHNLLRKGEAESVMDTFVGKFEMDVVKIDARERFMSQLAGVSDPEQKRKIIGNEFIRVFEEESAKLGEFDFLAQGTLYSDVVESSSATGQTIKSHHNVGGLPEDMTFALIEPLKTLFKDEVRKVGAACGLPNEIVMRQPFPGPGLAIRVLGEVTEDKLAIVREADAILREEIAKAGLEREIWQYFAALPNMKSVGVTDGERTYSYTVGLRAITSVDGMTAHWARIPYDVLDTISQRITSEVPNVNRVVLDITSKPPATIEWE